MVEKLKKISNKKIVIITSIVMLLVLIAGVSYAIWSRSFTQTGTNLSKYDCFDIVYAENVNEVSLSNGYPITDEEGLKAESYDLTIKNTCKILANYEVVLNKLNTSTLNDTNVKIAVDSDISLLSDLKTTNTNLTNATEGKVLTTGILASGQSKTIKIQSWMDENTTKTEGAGKSFSYKVTAEATTGVSSKSLIKLALNSNKIYDTKPDLSLMEPNSTSYVENEGVEKTFTSQIYQPLYNTDYNDGIELGTGYTFNAKTGTYTLTNISNGTYDQSSIGKYTCKDLNCTSVLKIEAVKESNDSNYYKESIQNDQKVSLVGNAVNKVCTGYEYEPYTGKYELSGCTLTASYSQDSIGKYTCNGYDVCKGVYLIKEVNEDVVTKADIITAKENYNYITKAIEYTAKSTTETSGGIYKTTDEDGITYYNRGDINNNYVMFADQLWRIMRINGDGSIRLIAEKSIGQSIYNKYVSATDRRNYGESIMGYTYNNSSSSKKDGTPSYVKVFLDSYYNGYLSKYNDKIALSKFINEVGIDSESDLEIRYLHYGDYLPDDNYSYSGREATFGGLYNLKIGLPIRNDIDLSGIYPSNYKNFRSYINNGLNFMTMTPEIYWSNNDSTIYAMYYNQFLDNFIATDQNVRPVISLKSNTLITSGDGSLSNPYVIK